MPLPFHLTLSLSLPRSVLAHISEEQHSAHCAPPSLFSRLHSNSPQLFPQRIPNPRSQPQPQNLHFFLLSSSGYGGSVILASNLFLDGGVARGRERVYCSGFDDAVVEANSPLLRRSSEGAQVFAVGDKRQCRSVAVEEEEQRLLPSPVKQ